MIGTVQPRNILHRFGDALQAWKAAPKPASLYPPKNSGAAGAYPISWPGWAEYERNYASDQSGDLARAKVAVTSPWVFSDITAIANEASVATLQIKERDDSDEGESDIENHPLELVWEKPNAFMGRSFLTSFWIWQRILSGKAYLFWVPDTSGKIAECWPVPTWMMTPRAHPTKFIDAYIFKANQAAKPIEIDAKYITYSRIPHPFDIRDGLSPLCAIYTEIEADLAMARWNKTFFSKENAAPSGLITVPADTLDQDLQTIRAEIMAFFSTESGRRVGVARAGDMDWKPFDRSQKDMEFLLGRKFEGAIIDRVLGFPEGFWSKDATRANSEGAKATMIENAVWPHLVALSEDLNAQTVPQWFGKQFRATFDDIRPRNRALELQEYTAYQATDTLDELRASRGKPPIGDVRGEMLVAEIAKGTPIPATPASTETEDTIAEMEDQAAEEAGVTGEELPTDEGATPLDQETPPEEEAPMKSVDLARWERKALRALKRDGRAAVAFKSTTITTTQHARISEALKAAQTAQDVRAAFEDIESLIDSVDAEARRWVEEATRDE